MEGKRRRTCGIVNQDGAFCRIGFSVVVVDVRVEEVVAQRGPKICSKTLRQPQIPTLAGADHVDSSTLIVFAVEELAA